MRTFIAIVTLILLDHFNIEMDLFDSFVLVLTGIVTMTQDYNEVRDLINK